MPAATVHPRHRRRLRLVLRILVSVALFAVLLSRIHFGDFVPHRHGAGTWFYLGAAIALMGVSFVLGAWRWQRVLAIFGHHVGLRTLVSHTLAGQFVGNVLPSTVGGDVLRISRSSSDVGDTTEAFAAVVLERLTGFFFLPLLVVAGFALDPALFSTRRSPLALLIACGTVAVFASLLFLAGHPRVAGRFAERANWMRAIGAVHTGVDRLRRAPRAALAAIGAALVYQVTVVASVGCAFHVVDVRVSTGAILAFVPAVAMAQVVPITLGGLGVREGLLALFLRPLGVSTGQAVAVGLLWYAIVLLVSLLGAPAFAVGHRRREATTP